MCNIKTILCIEDILWERSETIYYASPLSGDFVNPKHGRRDVCTGTGYGHRDRWSLVKEIYESIKQDTEEKAVKKKNKGVIVANRLTEEYGHE